MSAAPSLLERRKGFVDPAWLTRHLREPSLRVLDLRTDAVATPPPARRQRARGGVPGCFLRAHVPGAVPFEARALFEASGAVVSAPELALAMSSAGVGDEHTVVLVDDPPGAAALAVAWALERYGHAEVCILEGGFARWLAEKRPVTREVVRPPVASFTARRPA